MSETNEDRLRCPAIKKNGEPCAGYAGSSGFCIGHNPDAAEARSKGGSATSRSARAGKLLPARLRPVASLLEKAIQEVYEGKLSPRIATAMASLTSALVRVVTAGELEERVRGLEKGVTTIKMVYEDTIDKP